MLLQRKDVEHKTLLGRLGTTEGMAAATTFLASDDASYITGETCSLSVYFNFFLRL